MNLACEDTETMPMYLEQRKQVGIWSEVKREGEATWATVGAFEFYLREMKKSLKSFVGKEYH